VAAQATGVHRRIQSLEVRVARTTGVERREPLGGLEQQGWSVAAAAQRKRDPTAQHLHLGALEFAKRSGLRSAEQCERRVGGAGLVLDLGGREGTSSPARGLERQCGGTLEERGSGRQSSPGLRAPGRALQLGGDLLVWSRRRLGKMPSTAIGVDLRIGRVRQRAMHGLPLLR
jgi:hypothetical protein